VKPSKHKWLVQIRLGCRRVRLGYLDDFDDARRVYLGAKLLRTYANQRIAFYSEPDRPLTNDAETARTQAALWASVLPEAKAHPTQVTAILVSGMNDVINSQGYALAAWRDRLPMEVWALLILVAAACNFLIGFGADRLPPATQAILPLTAALAFVLIADVEGPRNGLVQVDPINLRDAAKGMHEE
jgi:hypothetical protein